MLGEGNFNCPACKSNMCIKHNDVYRAEVLGRQEEREGKNLFEVTQEQALSRTRWRSRLGIRHVHGPHRSGH